MRRNDRNETARGSFKKGELSTLRGVRRGDLTTGEDTRAAGWRKARAPGSPVREQRDEEGYMQAVILAAGRGSRLGAQLPKCLVEVGGRLLIDHQLEALAMAGAETPVVVVGYGKRLVRPTVGRAARFAVND